MQFWGEIWPNNRLASHLWGWCAPAPSGKFWIRHGQMSMPSLRTAILCDISKQMCTFAINCMMLLLAYIANIYLWLIF